MSWSPRRVWLVELQEPEPVSGHCPAKGQVVKDCASPQHHHNSTTPECVIASTDLGPNCPGSAASPLLVWPLLRERNLHGLDETPIGLNGDRTSQVSFADPCACAPFLCLGWLLEEIPVNCFIFLFTCLRWEKMAKYFRDSIARDDLRVQVEKRQQQQQAVGRGELGSPVPYPEQGQSMRLTKIPVFHSVSLVLRVWCRVQDFFTMKQLGYTWRQFT